MPHLSLSRLVLLLLLAALATAMTSPPSSPPSSSSSASSGPRRITLIRHGRTYANEYLTSVSPWGCPNFRDSETLRDSVLNDVGVQQATQLYDRVGEVLADSESESTVLICISPLTRTLETFRLGFGYPTPPSSSSSSLSSSRRPPHLQSIQKLALPLLRERTYMISDMGTPLSDLKSRYGHFVDFGLVPDQSWWFEHDEASHGPYVEWRPSGEGQRYLVKGEPPHVFRSRMLELVRFLEGRTEDHVICVTSWGVISELTGANPNNCDIVDNVTLEAIRCHLK